jgi:hypothetical protein
LLKVILFRTPMLAVPLNGFAGAAARRMKMTADVDINLAVTFFIPPLRNRIHFGITNRQRTSEEVSGLLAESSQRLLASNSEQPPTDPFPGFAFGDKVP